MGVIDPRLLTGLLKMQRAYDRLLSVRASAIDQYNADKDALDARWQADLLPVMADLYWYPFRNGISEAPEDDASLRQWLKDRFRDASVVAALLALLRRYHQRAANLGGQAALDLLGINGAFNLTEEAYLHQLVERAEMLTTQGSEQSLIDTTVDDLSKALPAARQDDAGALLALGIYIATRAGQRTVLIERYERPWAVGRALDWTYAHNGLSHKMYDVNGIGCVRVCADWHGLVFTINQHSTLIPQHSGCDCIWSPVRYDGEVVGTPPVTVSVPDLPPWTPPATPWTGGTL